MRILFLVHSFDRLSQRLFTDPVAVQHIVRPFDPCVVCTVH